jgi:hypothetical protein
VTVDKKLTELAGQDEWDKYERRLDRLWRKHNKERIRSLVKPPADGGSSCTVPVVRLAQAFQFAWSIGVEPELWENIEERTQMIGRPVQATIRGLLGMWVIGQVDPWEDSDR